MAKPRAVPTDPDAIAREVSRDIKRATRLVLKKLGRDAVKARKADLRRAFKTVSKRRLGAVRAFVGKYGGQVIIADMAPQADIQDEGGVIRAKTPRGLAVGRSAFPGVGRGQSFIRSGQIRSRKGRQLIASFVSSVRVPRLRVGFEGTVAKIAEQFEAEFERELNK